MTSRGRLLDLGLIAGNYKVQLYDPRTNGFAASSPEIGMHVEIRDPDDKIILSKVKNCDHLSRTNFVI